MTLSLHSKRARMASVLLVGALAISGCGGGGGDDDKDDRGSEEKTSDTPSVDTDAGVTEPGSELELGESATIDWAPTQRVNGRIAVTVNRLDAGPRKDIRAIKIDPPPTDPKLYYVRLTVENAGETDLGGVSALSLPLYVDDGSDVLMPAADVRLAYEPCPLEKLPARFGPGRKADLCLVYVLQQTELRSMALRPSDTEAAITWTGEITRPVTPKKKPKKQR